MAKQVVEAQQSHFETSTMISMHVKSVWDSRQIKAKRKLVSVVRGPFVRTDHPKKFLACLKDRSSSKGLVETGPADETEKNFPLAVIHAVDDLTGRPGADS